MSYGYSPMAAGGSTPMDPIDVPFPQMRSLKKRVDIGGMVKTLKAMGMPDSHPLMQFFNKMNGTLSPGMAAPAAIPTTGAEAAATAAEAAAAATAASAANSAAMQSSASSMSSAANSAINTV